MYVLCMYVCLYLSVCLCVCLCLSVCLCVCLCITRWLLYYYHHHHHHHHHYYYYNNYLTKSRKVSRAHDIDVLRKGAWRMDMTCEASLHVHRALRSDISSSFGYCGRRNYRHLLWELRAMKNYLFTLKRRLEYSLACLGRCQELLFHFLPPWFTHRHFNYVSFST